MTSGFFQWIDAVLSTQLPEGIAAFHFNIYDAPSSYDIELVGCPAYDPNDPDWACDAIFMSRKPRFEIPHGAEGRDWERGLAMAIHMLALYVTG
jgi:hypothetical protein